MHTNRTQVMQPTTIKVTKNNELAPMMAILATDSDVSSLVVALTLTFVNDAPATVKDSMTNSYFVFDCKPDNLYSKFILSTTVTVCDRAVAAMFKNTRQVDSVAFCLRRCHFCKRFAMRHTSTCDALQSFKNIVPNDSLPSTRVNVSNEN
jgi:hypothetical protein